MSKVVEDKLYIQTEEPEKCEYCGKVAELRPYGKNGAKICFQCAMKDPKTTEKMFRQVIEGVKEVVVVNNSLN